MEVLEIIKRIKEIKPDPDYTKKSRLVVLSSEQFDQRPSVFKLWLVSGMRYGSALVLASLVIILILGGFSIKRSSEELITGLDLRSLRVEAEAIDIQIRLNSLDYDEVSKIKDVFAGDATADLGSGENSEAAAVFGEGIFSNAEQEETGAALKPGDSTSTTSLSVEDVLEKLAQ